MEKLVRQLDFADAPQRTRRARPEELPMLLGRKLVEESRELLEVLMFHGTVMLPDQRRARLLDELGDVFDVCDTIIKLHGIQPLRVTLAIEEKQEERGKFVDKVLTDAPDDREETQLRSLVEDLLRELIDSNLGEYGYLANKEKLDSLRARADKLSCLGETA
jgi:predicted house-cleaning noncanonical NTP pyrophosphatase (MazG superfamily)